jgi:hypothetical protein
MHLDLVAGQSITASQPVLIDGKDEIQGFNLEYNKEAPETIVFERSRAIPGLQCGDSWKLFSTSLWSEVALPL